MANSEWQAGLISFYSLFVTHYSLAKPNGLK